MDDPYREKREKGNAGTLQLPQIALDIIGAQPRFVGNPYVIAGRGAAPLTIGSYHKGKLDEACGVERWVLHDLRAYARSLMSRAGINSELAERILGHAVGNLVRIYDRHDYASEKAEALRKLAALVERIVDPPIDNVVALHEAVAS